MSQSHADTYLITFMFVAVVLLIIESLVARWRDQQINKRIDKLEEKP